MATVKVFDSKGVKELQCFDTLANVDYLDPHLLFDPEEEDLPDPEE